MTRIAPLAAALALSLSAGTAFAQTYVAPGAAFYATAPASADARYAPAAPRADAATAPVRRAWTRGTAR